MPESTTTEVSNRIPANVKVPQGCYCFYFYDQEVIAAKNVLCDNDIEFKSDRLGLEEVCQTCDNRFKCATSHSDKMIYGKQKNQSPHIYFGEKFTVDELKARQDPDLRTLISNLEINEMKYGVQCITGNWQWANDEEIVIPSHSDLKSMTEVL